MTKAQKSRGMIMSCEGLLVIFCGPSGVGKGTILNIAKERNPKIKYSVSATTRSPRQGEKDGESYFFKTVDEFEEMIKNEELIEWVEYCGNYYGTPKKYVEEAISDGFDMVLEIEVEGAGNIKKMYPEAVTVFVLPPSFDKLKERLVGRGTEKIEVIEKRLKRAQQEIMHTENYEYIIINDDIEKAVESFNSILTAEKAKYKRNLDIVSQMISHSK